MRRLCAASSAVAMVLIAAGCASHRAQSPASAQTPRIIGADSASSFLHAARFVRDTLTLDVPEGAYVAVLAYSSPKWPYLVLRRGGALSLSARQAEYRTITSLPPTSMAWGSGEETCTPQATRGTGVAGEVQSAPTIVCTKARSASSASAGAQLPTKTVPRQFVHPVAVLISSKPFDPGNVAFATTILLSRGSLEARLLKVAQMLTSDAGWSGVYVDRR